MRILGIETSGHRAGIALMADDTVVAAGELNVRGRTGEKLADMTRSLLRLAEWKLGDLHRLAVDVGPGSFTGLRVGMALSKGLSLGAGVPVVGVSSLEAQAAMAAGDGLCVASLPAPRGMVYAAAFVRRTGAARCVIEEACWKPDALTAAVSRECGAAGHRRVQALGPAADHLGDGLIGGPCEVIGWPGLRPSAEAVARLGAREGRPVPTAEQLSEMVPRYLRGADVRQPGTAAPTQTAP